MKNKWFDMGRKEADEHFELDGLESISYCYREYMNLIWCEKDLNELEYMKGYIDRANELWSY